MQQTVYLDVLIFLNSIINFYILFISGMISHSRIKKWRIILGGFLGGLSSGMILLPEMNFFLSFLIKAAISIIMILVSFEYLNFSRFIKRYIIFMLTNFIFAGAVLFVCFVFKTPLIYYNNSNFYFDISTVSLVIITTITYILLSITVKYSSKSISIQKYYELEVYKGVQKIKCVALADTGNSLTDVFSGSPVIIIDFKAVKPLLSDEFTRFYLNEITEMPSEEIRLIPFSDISGRGFLKAFKCDSVRLSNDVKSFEIKDALIAVYNKNLSAGNYEAIINPEIFNITKEVA